eukprot:Nk52_evm16s255 gene=Nk52_evmTU16s255
MIFIAKPRPVMLSVLALFAFVCLSNRVTAEPIPVPIPSPQEAAPEPASDAHDANTDSCNEKQKLCGLKQTMTELTDSLKTSTTSNEKALKTTSDLLKTCEDEISVFEKGVCDACKAMDVLKTNLPASDRKRRDEGACALNCECTSLSSCYAKVGDAFTALGNSVSVADETSAKLASEISNLEKCTNKLKAKKSECGASDECMSKTAVAVNDEIAAAKKSALATVESHFDTMKYKETVESAVCKFGHKDANGWVFGWRTKKTDVKMYVSSDDSRSITSNSKRIEGDESKFRSVVKELGNGLFQYTFTDSFGINDGLPTSTNKLVVDLVDEDRGMDRDVKYFNTTGKYGDHWSGDVADGDRDDFFGTGTLDISSVIGEAKEEYIKKWQAILDSTNANEKEQKAGDTVSGKGEHITLGIALPKGVKPAEGMGKPCNKVTCSCDITVGIELPMW